MTLKLETAMYEYLNAQPEITALVLQRIFYQRLPEKTTLPAISWHRVSASRVYTHDSFDDTDPWVRARVQFNCWGTTAESSMEVGEAVLAALSGYEGDMSGQLIGSSFAIDEFDVYETPTKFHRRILDFMVSYEDDVGTEPVSVGAFSDDFDLSFDGGIEPEPTSAFTSGFGEGFA